MLLGRGRRAARAAQNAEQVANTVRYGLAGDFAQSRGDTYIQFDRRLQHRGSDYRVYANTWSQSQPQDDETELLYCILRRLFSDRSGVEQITISPFKLALHRSPVVPVEEIMLLIPQGITDAGLVPVSVELPLLNLI